MNRVFLLSSERTGSNLLRSLFAEQADIYAPYAPHLLKANGSSFTQAEPKSSEERQQFIELMVELTNVHMVPWKLEMADLGDLTSFLKADSWEFLNLFDHIYSCSAKKHGFNAYFVKENNVFDYALSLQSHFDPQAYFIYLVRDPRDVFASFSKVPGGPNNAIVFCEKWKREQEVCLRFLEQLPETKYEIIRYEDLVTSPQDIVARCMDKFSLDKKKASSEEMARSDSPYFKNIGKKIMSTNFNKYKTALQKKEVRLIEGACGEVMERFSYQMDSEIPLHYSATEKKIALIQHRAKIIYNFLTMIRWSELKMRLRRQMIYRKIKRFAH